VRRSPAALLFTLPALTGLALFVALPFVLAIGFSFTDLRTGSPLPTQFVGLRQYARIFADEDFLRGLRNNAVFTLVVVPVQTSLALGLALLLHLRLRGLAVFRTLFFLPVVFPLTLVAVVWVLLFAPGPDGTINALLSTITLGAWTPRDFLLDPAFALPAIMATSIWQGAGFQMVILLAALQSVPEELYEAASIDGAGRWRRFLHVTLPQLRPALVFVALVTTILCFRLFDQVQVMTQGRPEGATTTVLYEAVVASRERGQVARGSAMTVVLFAVVLGVTLLQRRLTRRTAG
jgi:multiple sugar transport system permease protein